MFQSLFLKNRLQADLGTDERVCGEESNHWIAGNAQNHFRCFFLMMVPFALQDFRRLRVGCGAKKNRQRSGNAMVFHGTVQTLRAFFPQWDERMPLVRDSGQGIQ
ncbi:MAG: hypothetical protein ACLPY1_17350 [Terracidiphilus sp.]